MANNWGLCKDCKWWKIEPDGTLESLTMGGCFEKSIQPFALRVSGNSGCNRFAHGNPIREKGASEIPSDAK